MQEAFHAVHWFDEGLEFRDQELELGIGRRVRLRLLRREGSHS